jgi:hypothetical protein
MKNKLKAEAWAEAKKRCRLNASDIRMATELGMTPKSLIKNIPSKSQQWKMPVKDWVRDLFSEKFGKVLASEIALKKDASSKRQEKSVDPDEDECPHIMSIFHFKSWKPEPLIGSGFFVFEKKGQAYCPVLETEPRDLSLWLLKRG